MTDLTPDRLHEHEAMEKRLANTCFKHRDTGLMVRIVDNPPADGKGLVYCPKCEAEHEAALEEYDTAYARRLRQLQVEHEAAIAAVMEKAAVAAENHGALNGHMMGVEIAAEIRSLAKDVEDALREAKAAALARLWPYATHKESCRIRDPYPHGLRQNPCDCGFEETRRAMDKVTMSDEEKPQCPKWELPSEEEQMLEEAAVTIQVAKEHREAVVAAVVEKAAQHFPYQRTLREPMACACGWKSNLYGYDMLTWQAHLKNSLAPQSAQDALREAKAEAVNNALDRLWELIRPSFLNHDTLRQAMDKVKEGRDD